MSTLENDVQPILRRLFSGSTSLDAIEQAQLALWATMKAVLVDSATTTVVPRGFGRDLKIRKAPPAGVQVWAAAFSDELGFLSTHPWLILAEETDPDPDQVIAYCVTIVVFKVVFQVSIPFFDGMQTQPNDFLGAVLPIWPHLRTQLSWPPPFSFDRESVMALATRIYDNRESVITNVTLTSTTAER